MSTELPLSTSYRKPIFDAVGLQVLLGCLSLLLLDGGATARLCGIALISFWGGAIVVIWRRPQAPTRSDMALIQFGSLPVVVFAFILGHWGRIAF